MEDILETLVSKMKTEGKYESFNAEYLLLKTNEARVRYQVELFLEHSMPIIPIVTPKSTLESTRFREEGNGLFTLPRARTQFDKAIQLYTKSIAFAPDGSAELAIGYANRSAVLFKARLYQDCLLDISRALALPYPDDLKSKLYTRQARCLMSSKITSKTQKLELETSLQNARLWLAKIAPSNQSKLMIQRLLDDPESAVPVQAPFVKWSAKGVPKLKEESKTIRGVSSSLELRYSEKFGKHVVAIKDIEPGEVLAVMKPYASVLVPEKFYTHCWHCLEQSWSSVPCPNCVNVVYCSEDCRKKAWEEHHDLECDVIGPLTAVEMSNLGLLSLRTVVRAIKEAGSVQALMKKVEELEKRVGRTKDIEGVFDDRDYANVYTLTTNTEKRSLLDLFGRSGNTTYIIFMLATRSEAFGKKLRGDLRELKDNPEVMFVAGLIMRHQQIIPNNVHITTEESLSIVSFERAAAIMPFYSLMNHSCNLQTSRITYGKNMVFYADTIITKGEQVFDNYGNHYVLEPKHSRQARLSRQFQFTCECQACVEDWPTSFGVQSFENQYSGKASGILQIRKALENFPQYYRSVYSGKFNNSLAMVDDLNNMLKTLALHAKPPCREVNDVIELKQRVMGLMGNRYQTLDA